jgi:hypothetical protein
MNSSQPVPAYERGTRQRIFRTLSYRTGILHSQSIAQVTNRGDIAGNKLYDKRYVGMTVHMSSRRRRDAFDTGFRR